MDSGKSDERSTITLKIDGVLYVYNIYIYISYIIYIYIIYICV